MFWTLMKRREDLERARQEGLEEGRRRGREAALERLSKQGYEANAESVGQAEDAPFASGPVSHSMLPPAGEVSRSVSAEGGNELAEGEKETRLSLALNGPPVSQEFLEMILVPVLVHRDFTFELDPDGRSRLIVAGDADQRKE